MRGSTTAESTTSATAAETDPQLAGMRPLLAAVVVARMWRTERSLVVMMQQRQAQGVRAVT